MQRSIWTDTCPPLKITKKVLPTQVDILIIGAGIAGIHTAFYLKDCNKKIIMIDKGKIGRGITSYTTGKLTYLQGIIYSKIANIYGKEKSLLYYLSQKEAISLATTIIKKENINCDLERVPSYLFMKEKNEKYEKEKEILKDFKVPFKETPIPIHYPYEQAIKVEDTYIFHPLKYLYQLAHICERNGISIYENTCAYKIKKEGDSYIVNTNEGTIKASYVVTATHYPFFIQPSFIPLKSHIEKSYLLSVQKKVSPLSMINGDTNIITMRNYNDYFIIGGEAHKASCHINTKAKYRELIEEYHLHFNDPIRYIWMAHDVMTDDHMPYIGKVSKDNNHLFIATGFNKWGMTNGILAGKIISDILLKKENPYIELLAPYRTYNAKRGLEMMTNMIETGKIYVQTKIKKKKKFYPNTIKIIKEKGKNYGIYIDEDKKEHKVSLTCPHMGCTVIFNEKDKTWDCPCHGSRFSVDGDIIEGPSCYSIRPKKNK